MIGRFVLPAALLALSPVAHADDLSGWWKISSLGWPLAERRTPSSVLARPGAVYIAPSPSNPPQDANDNEPSQAESCGFDGQLMLKEISGKPGAAECSITLSHTCSSPPGNHLTVLQACTIMREGDVVTITGKNVAILEATPAQLWPKTYSPDVLRLTVSADRKSMSGESTRNVRVRVAKIADLVE